MTIGIYAIRNIESDKRYIGKSVNIEHRFWCHRNNLTKTVRNEKHTNRHLWNAVQKHGIEAFAFEIVETFAEVDETLIAARELYWMDFYKTCDRTYGYNLRRDSSTKMEVHPETRLMRSVFSLGSANPNYGNKWSDEQRSRMSVRMKSAHQNGNPSYGDEWRAKLAVSSSRIWKDDAKKRAMAEKVSRKKEKYNFEQYTKDGKLLKTWTSVKTIVSENPAYKWQNIYSVCNGYKPTYMGFVWKKVLKG